MYDRRHWFRTVIYRKATTSSIHGAKDQGSPLLLCCIHHFTQILTSFSWSSTHPSPFTQWRASALRILLSLHISGSHIQKKDGHNFTKFEISPDKLWGFRSDISDLKQKIANCKAFFYFFSESKWEKDFNIPHASPFLESIILYTLVVCARPLPSSVESSGTCAGKWPETLIGLQSESPLGCRRAMNWRASLWTWYM